MNWKMRRIHTEIKAGIVAIRGIFLKFIESGKNFVSSKLMRNPYFSYCPIVLWRINNSVKLIETVSDKLSDMTQDSVLVKKSSRRVNHCLMLEPV